MLCVTTLAIGIGLVVAIFSLVYGIVLQQLPYPNADRLVVITHDAPGLDLEDINISEPLYERYREISTSFEHLALVADGQLTLTTSDRPDRVDFAAVTASLFPMLGTRAHRGRVLADSDADEGAPSVAVISHAAWVERFGASDDAVGQMIELDGEQRRIVGVMPANFEFPDADDEVWLPMKLGVGPGRLGAFGVRGFGLLSPGVELESAMVDLQRVTSDLEGFFPEEPATPVLERAELRPLLIPLHERIVGQVRRGLWLGLGAVALVLALACANVANLFLVRAENRQQEIAVRSALGARRSGVVWSFLAEGLLLALVGGALGVGVAHLALRALRVMAPENLPRLGNVGIDLTVLTFALAVSLIAAVAFSVLPALQVVASEFSSALKEGSRGAGWGRRRVQTRQVLVSVQVALGVVLLISAGLLIRTYSALGNVELGFEPSNVLTLRAALAANEYPSENELAALVQELLPTVEALPGVRSVAVASELPLSGRGSGAGHAVEDHPLAEDELPPVFYMTSVSEGYFETLEVPILEGRAIERADWEERRGVVVVSETLARRWWPDGSALGRRLRQGRPPQEEGEGWYEVVGVAADLTDQDLRGEAVPRVYYPVRGREGDGGLRGGFVLLARSETAPSQLTGALREALWSLDPNIPITRIQPLQDQVDDARAGTEFSMTLLLFAALLALVLGAVGVYGVISYVVTLRTREIGLRLALGAQQRGIRNQVLRSGLVLCAAGVAVGLIAALMVTRLLRSLLFEVSTVDPVTYLVVPVVLLLAAALASYLPARRASRTDPAIALRWE